MNIVCHKNLLSKFRRECRKRFPNEHFAAIYGHRSPEGDFLITKVALVAHTSDSSEVHLTEKSITQSKRAALRQEVDWLGTIHSHCFEPKEPTCWHLSERDIQTALAWGEAICGLVYVYDGGRHTDMHWYVPQPAPNVIYTGKLPV